VESVSHLHVDLAGFDEVGAAKGVAVVEQEAPIRHIDRLYCHEPMLAKTFTQRHIN
jgi:hypothetical protein